MSTPEYQSLYLDRDQNFYDQVPFKEALDRAYEVLDPEHTNPLLNMGGLRRSLTKIAQNPRRLHRSLPEDASEDLVNNWLLTGRGMLPKTFINGIKLPARPEELREVLRALGSVFQQIPDWMEYIRTYCTNNYANDGVPRTRLKRFSPAIRYSEIAARKALRFELLELGGLERMIKKMNIEENDN